MKFLLIACFVFVSAIAKAQNSANLTISTTGNSNLKITFNGNKYSLQDRSVTFQSLTPGNYTLTIFQLQKRIDGYEEYVNVFDKSISLNPGKHLEISVLRFGKTAWDENYIEKDEWNQTSNNPQPVNSNSNQDGYKIPVDPIKFASIRKAINGEVNETERIRVCRVAMKNNWFTIQQIREIGQTFFNESNKLTVIKFAYDYCVDQSGYISLSDMFFNATERRELVDFIAGK